MQKKLLLVEVNIQIGQGHESGVSRFSSWYRRKFFGITQSVCESLSCFFSSPPSTESNRAELTLPPSPSKGSLCVSLFIQFFHILFSGTKNLRNFHLSVYESCSLFQVNRFHTISIILFFYFTKQFETTED